MSRRPSPPTRRIRAAAAALIAALVAAVAPSLATGFGAPQFPVAVVSASNTVGLAPLTTTFDGSASYGVELSVPTIYTWSFGDGGSATGVTASHTYTTSGMFTATLTVTDQNGVTGSASVLVAAFVRPTVSLTTSATSGRAPLAVDFTASATLGSGRTVRSVVWDFGDGVTSTGTSLTASHVYTGLGLFTASVSVTDDAGWASTAYVTITPTQPMAPPTNLKATSPRRSTATLTWTNRMAAAAVKVIEVQRCPGSRCTNFATVYYLPSGSTSFTEGVAKGAYRYRLRIVDFAGGTGSSNIAAVTVR